MNEIHRLGEEAGQQARSHFLFGDVVLTAVPHEVGSMKLRHHALPEVQMSGNVVDGDPLSVVERAQALRRWTLVFGLFGAGKSTLSRRMSQLANRQLLYIPASALTHAEAGSGSENSLARAIVEYLGVFDEASEFSDEERRVINWLAGPLLAARLRDQKTKFTLLIDGLDENRFYASMQGLQVLTNELARTSCPIVLTTRREHFFDHYVTYGERLGRGSRFATKSQEGQEIQLVELHGWSTQHAIAYVDEAVNRADSLQKERLLAFRAKLLDGTTSGELALQHPLLLAIAVDLVATEDVIRLGSRADLYARWTRRKILRDLQVPRPRPEGYENAGMLVDTILDFMADVALSMVEPSEGGSELTELTDEISVRAIARERFGGPVESDIYTTVSFLEPVRQRGAPGALKLKFFHRSFQEYFLAVALRQRGQSSRGYPSSIQTFIDELVASV